MQASDPEYGTGADNPPTTLFPQEPYRTRAENPPGGTAEEASPLQPPPVPPDAGGGTSRRAAAHTESWVRTAAIAMVAGAVGAALAGGPQNLGFPAPDPIDRTLRATYTVEAGERQSGTAVLVTDTGHLVTSAHLVSGLSTVTLTAHDGTRESALVVGVDSQSDLAVLRIGSSPQDHLELRTGVPARPGEEVLAVGAPFGFRNTVTRGIISGDDRVLRFGDGTTILTGLIQTDASINPGNSGGPLVDMEGRVVGISTAISTSTGTSQGVGFAVPADAVRRVLDDLIEKGEVSYARIGVDVLDTLDRSGARVSAVTPGGAAEEAGIREGDVITAVAGRPVRSSGELVGRVRSHLPGEAVTVTIERYGETRMLNVTLKAA